MASVRFGSRTIRLPRNWIVRNALGAFFIVLGSLGFLPILGFWMLPLGLLVLSVDVPAVRRWRRRMAVWWARRRQARATPPPEGRDRPPTS